MTSDSLPNGVLDGVAIIGMAGRFPGAASVAEFWQNQLKGVESISHFRVDELEVPNAAELSEHSNYVRAHGVLPDPDLFDAEFFGMLPREAELTDPQHRVFLECSWEVLESAGYDPFSYAGSIGVFAGSSMCTYFLSRLCPVPGFIEKFTGDYQIGNYPQLVGNSPDFFATRVSYKLNLRGPAFTMQAGCSTSLLAVCQALRAAVTDAVQAVPGTDPDRASWQTAVETAQNLVTTARNITGPAGDLTGDIGRAVLANLHGPRRPRVCARKVKSPLSRWNKHPPGKPRTCQRITKITTTISQEHQPAATRRQRCVTTARSP